MMKNRILLFIVLIAQVFLFGSCQNKPIVPIEQITTGSTTENNDNQIIDRIDPELYADPEHTYYQDSALQVRVRGIEWAYPIDNPESANLYADRLKEELAPYLNNRTFLIDGTSCNNDWELYCVDSFTGGWCAYYLEVIDESGLAGKSERELIDIHYSIHDSSRYVLFANDGHVINIIFGMSMMPMQPSKSD